MQSSAIDLRPKTWGDVLGQQHIITGIQNKIKSGIPPAWLFIGDPGSGKTSCAEILAREVQGGADLELLEFLDIRRINAADKNGVDDARALADESRYHPTYGKYRVIIMDEAHMLTPSAQNTLLIPTEQVNSPTVWIFCTTDPHKIIPALRSRCVVFEMRPLDKSNIANLVSKAAQGASTDEFVEIVVKNHLTNPREILYAWDKYASGVPIKDAITVSPENDPAYVDVAKYAGAAQWNHFKQNLNSLKNPDAKGLKSVLVWQLKYKLLNSEIGSVAGDAASEALIRIGSITAFEDGVVLSALVGIVYNYCRKVTKNAEK